MKVLLRARTLPEAIVVYVEEVIKRPILEPV